MYVGGTWEMVILNWGWFFADPAPWNVRQYCDFWLSELGVLVARDVAVNALQHAGP